MDEGNKTKPCITHIDQRAHDLVYGSADLLTVWGEASLNPVYSFIKTAGQICQDEHWCYVRAALDANCRINLSRMKRPTNRGRQTGFMWSRRQHGDSGLQQIGGMPPSDTYT